MIQAPEETLTGRNRYAHQRRYDWRQIGPGTPKTRIERTFDDDPARGKFIDDLCRRHRESREVGPRQLKTT